MTQTQEPGVPRHRIFTTPLASVHPHYVAKVERKGRTRGEVDEAIRWLTGYDAAGLEAALEQELDFETFFDRAPAMTPHAALITGSICGIRVEEVEDPSCARSACSTSSSTRSPRGARWPRCCGAGKPSTACRESGCR